MVMHGTARAGVGVMMHTQEQCTSGQASDLRTLLAQDHARLEQLFDRLLAAFRADDRDEVATLWSAFDVGLEAHMELEEERILPEFAKVDSLEAAALAREHVAIRNLLNELGIGVDLHSTKAEAVERFIFRLREHAKREDALMYRWACANLQDAVQTSIRTRLLATLRGLVKVD